MTALDKIPQDEILDAIRQDAHDAIWRMITSATDCPGHDFFDTIREAIKEGIEDSMPLNSEIKEAIADGIAKAMPKTAESAVTSVGGKSKW